MKSAIHPSLSRPASNRMTPTATAIHPTSCWYCGVPAAATVTTPAATTGAIVESAPTDICRLAPNTAIISDPTTKAERPVSAGILASRAVAICSGMAMATSVRPAITSPVNHDV